MTRLAVVGIDGATYEIIRPMIAAGELPHIARILREGVSGDLESEVPPMTPPAWTSMFTGLNPGKHGVFHFIRRDLGTYGCRLNDSRNYAGKDVMSLLGGRGWTIGSLAVPMTYPPFPVNGGYMISGIPMPLSGDTIAWPQGTVAEMREVLGYDYEPDVDYVKYDGDNEQPEEDLELYEPLREELFRQERDRLTLAKHYLKEKPTDFFFTVVSVTDRAQHYFWKFMDREHPGWTQEGEDRYGEVIRDAYRLADEFVGAVREVAGDEVPVALVSDHGFGPQHSDFHINTWLEQEGFLKVRKVPYWTWGKLPLRDALSRVGLGALGKVLGPLGRIPLLRPKRKTEADARDVIWEETRAFAQLHGVCVNMKGREPQGIVEGEHGYRQVLTELKAKLATLQSEDGVAALDRVFIKEEVYDGPRSGEAADMQFQMLGMRCINKEEWGEESLWQHRRTAPISGQHRFNGIFAYAGAGAAGGRVLEGMHIQDTAPTLLHAVGEAVPKWMDGRVMESLLAEPREPAWDDSPEPGGESDDKSSLSDDQTKAIEESLRGLGYLQ